jgi:hypothetical protein
MTASPFRPACSRRKAGIVIRPCRSNSHGTAPLKRTSKDANLRTYLWEVIDGSRQGLPGHGWIDTQAGVEAPGEYSAVPEAGSQFHGNRHSALVVQIPLILAEKHSAAFRH